MGFDTATDKMVLGRSISDMYAANMTSTTMINGLQTIGAKFETPQQAGLPSGLVYGNPWIFSPRLGFAYRWEIPPDLLVLRGGFGVFDSQSALRTWDNLTGSGIPYGYPIQYSVNNQALVGVNGIDGLPNYELRSAPQYVAGVNTTDVLSNPAYVSITPGCCALHTTTPINRPPGPCSGTSLCRGKLRRASWPKARIWARTVGTCRSKLIFNAAPARLRLVHDDRPAEARRHLRFDGEKMPTTRRPTAA